MTEIEQTIVPALREMSKATMEGAKLVAQLLELYGKPAGKALLQLPDGKTVSVIVYIASNRRRVILGETFLLTEEENGNLFIPFN